MKPHLRPAVNGQSMLTGVQAEFRVFPIHSGSSEASGASLGQSAYHAAMQKSLSQLKRKPLFLPLLIPVLLAIVGIGAAAWFFDARSTTVVIVVRHAEAESSDNDPDPGLSVDGKERAARLARVLSKAKPERAVDAVYATEFRRTQQTVGPIAETLGLPVTVVPASTWTKLGQRIHTDNRGQFVVACGTAAAIPIFIKAMTGQPVSIADEEYDSLFIIFLPQISKPKVIKLRY